MKRFLLIALLVFFLTSCNLPDRGLSPFIAPSNNFTPTPDWAATLQAVLPPTTESNPEEDPPAGVPTATVPAEPPTPIPTPPGDAPLLYYTQAGDTLAALAVRYGVDASEITSPDPIVPEGFINPNQLLIVPNRLNNTTTSARLLPDSDFVFSRSAAGFDIQAYVEKYGGYLSDYHEYLGSNGETDGWEIVQIQALDNSINPRLLLALLEYQSGWVMGQPSNLSLRDYPMGVIDLDRKGLLRQLRWTVNQLSIGYYNWREGRLSEIRFDDGVAARLAPDLNAGTAALQYFFAQVFDSVGWLAAVDPENGFPALYERMFGNPWVRAQAVEPLFPPDIAQPHLELPFLVGPIWSYTGGPHGAWEYDGSWAAIDFAPASTESGCVESYAWVTASAPGLVVRSGRGVVVLDLDGDGIEQTGWVLVYLHIASDNGRIKAGEWVETGDLLGHPSCEGGRSTGTHVHIARKYNGEWMTADGPIPFVLTGWQVHAGSAPYKGTMTRDGETVNANQFGAYESRITRDRYESSQ
jgi:LasA protease